MRLRTLARIRAIAHARRSVVPAALAVALVAAVGIGVGTTGAMAATMPSPAPSATLATTAERPVDYDTAFYVSIARAIQKSATGKVDTSELDEKLTELDDSSALPERSVRVLTRLVQESSTKLTTEVAAFDAQAAAQAAAKAAADAAAAAQAAADELAQANTPDGARATARAMAASQYGWGDGQFSCLESLWQKESSWNYQAYNPSGATGIPQALPGSKMASAGSDWETSATTQIAWGLGYIEAAYGTPCSAWGHSQSVNWY